MGTNNGRGKRSRIREKNQRFVNVARGTTTGNQICFNNISVVTSVTNRHLKSNIDFVANNPVRLLYFIIVACDYFNITYYYYCYFNTK